MPRLELQKNTGKKWYAFYTMPRTEKKVTERLGRKGIAVYLPLMETFRTWSDRRKKVTLPLIPGIVFVYIDLTELTLALATQGVVNVVRYLGKPAQIKEEEINNVKIIANQEQSFEWMPNLGLESGDLVLVNQGSFYGLVGEYVRMQGKYRVVIEIKALNSYIEVNVPTSFLQKVNKEVA